MVVVVVASGSTRLAPTPYLALSSIKQHQVASSTITHHHASSRTITHYHTSWTHSGPRACQLGMAASGVGMLSGVGAICSALHPQHLVTNTECFLREHLKSKPAAPRSPSPRPTPADPVLCCRNRS
jgi:hypothetical protein